MFGKRFELNEETIPVVEEIGRHMPGGFFIYKAEAPEELLYANKAVVDIFGCDDLDDFKALTGYTFKGMLHPDDYDAISKSVVEQIATNDDDLDYVEYRIIRKDGKVRWVDDYGHYTVTEAYGGIYYVFISDITEKRERMESDVAVRNAVIEALSESYHTVWLINDVETETFSLYRGDLVGNTPHAGPIKEALSQIRYSQAKEYYIETTVAPVDQKRLNEELALPRIVERLREKPQFNINYLRVMEDGSERYFRIEFAKVDMPGGRMGIVCGFKDVDEDVREGRAIQKALQEAKLIEEESNQQSRLITALASDYWSVYYLELDAGLGHCYQSHSDVDGLEAGEDFPYPNTFEVYAEKYITDEYREEFLRFIQPDSIRKGLARRQVISYTYMVRRNGRDTYETVRFAGVRHPEDRDDSIVHAVGACFVDVDEQMRDSMAQQQVLSDALVQAEEANRAKTAFLSNMSHEIRTPMNAIIGLDNIALSEPDLPEKTREHLSQIGSSAQHLLNIINDILDMSRIESGRMTLRHEEFSFSKTLEQVNTIISGQCRDESLEYECHLEGNISEYYVGDDMKLRQILINILGNAVKFTPEGGRVSLDVKAVAHYEGKSTLRFTISDTGIGISEDYLPRIFDAFSQETPSASSKYGSTGLGLPITKNLVEMMNGHIEVSSVKGEGTTFTVTVTLDDAEHGEGPVENDVPEPKDMTVLVIDDDPIALEHARMVLGQVGVDCETAGSGMEALEMISLRHARREPYNLILVDWKMPEMDGLETTKAIRELVGQESAILILTSYNWDDVEEEARASGVDTFVPKPLFASTVMDEFREAFRKKRRTAKENKADLAGRRILLAEDMAVNAEIMVMVLGMRDMIVDHAENGRIAVDMFAASESGQYDAILMDMRMPEMDGLEATRAIRAMDRTDAKEIPIIALTANAFDEDVQRSMQAGLDAHLSKPVEPDALFETLESLIKA